MVVKQAAQALGVSSFTITRWCESGKLPAIPKTYGRKTTWLISPAAIESLKHKRQASKQRQQANKTTQTKEALNEVPLKAHAGLVTPWLKALAQGAMGGKPYSPCTITSYRFYTEGFFKKHNVLNALTLQKALNRIAVEQFATKDKLYKALVCFGKYLIQHNALEPEFLEQVKSLKPKRHLPVKRTVVNTDGLTGLQTACESLQDRLIVTLLSQTGLRASEACALKWTDIDLKEGVLRVQLGKGNKSRAVGINQSLNIVLQEAQGNQISECEAATPWVLLDKDGQAMSRSGLYQRIERLGKKSQVKVSPHALRRAFVTINANQGRPLPMLQRACGHSDIKTTMGYCMTSEAETIAAMRGW